MVGKEDKVLRGFQVLPEMRKGREQWENYIRQYLDYSIEITAEEFAEAIGDKSFRCDAFLFPSGGVKFIGVKFSGRITSFSNATFNGGAIDFVECRFTSDLVAFTGADFDATDAVSFQGSKFTSKVVTFREADFGGGNTNFRDVNFGKGRVDFSSCRFSVESTIFDFAKFGDGRIDFSRASFGVTLSFRSVTVDSGCVDFSRVRVAMHNTFVQSKFGGDVLFTWLQESDYVKQFSLRLCTFSNVLDFQLSKLRCIVDLCGTKITNQIALDGLSGIAEEDHGNAALEALCRLKELAESNKDHSLALAFHAAELRAKRQDYSLAPRLVDWLFDATSEYGRSFVKPAKTLAISTFAFGFFYSVIHWLLGVSGKMSLLSFFKALGNGILYSVSQVVPFTLSGRAASKEAAEALFGMPDIPNWIYIFSIPQGITSFILLFLIGLGLRNHFRI